MGSISTLTKSNQLIHHDEGRPANIFPRFPWIVWRNRALVLGQKMPWRAEYHPGGTSSAQTRKP
jgi:hypothetical protein